MQKTFLKVVISLLVFSVIAKGQSIDSVFAKGKDLYARGDFEASIHLLNRVLYFDRKHRYDTLAFPLLADMYYTQHNYTKSCYYYKQALAVIACKDSMVQYKLHIIRNKLLSVNYLSALEELDSFKIQNDSTLLAQKNLLYAISFFGIEEYDSSKVYFTSLLPYRDIARAKELDDLFAKIKKGARHKYRAAIALSFILPGSGQILLGHTKDGINAFLLTTAFATLTIVTAVNYTPVEAVLSAFPWWLRYYRGNINHVLEQAEWRRFHNRSVLYQKVLAVVSPPR